MLKVLIVENELYVRKGIVLTVDWAAMDCLIVGEAANGEEGLEAARKYKPNLIITDIKMPKMDGIEMLRQLREEGCDAFVIMLTAYSVFEYAQSAIKLGAVDYLIKPFHDGELEAAVGRVREQLAPVRQESEQPPVLDALLDLNKGDKSKYVMQAMSYISEHYARQSLNLSEVAASIGISEGYLGHLFKKETDYTILEYITQYRVHMAIQLLRDRRVKIYEVAESVGYKDITYFSTTFKRLVGVSPSEFQARCR